MASTYHETYAAWQRDPDAFWGEAAKDIDWFTAPATVFDASEGIYGRWFPDGVCNTCFNCVDRHVAAGRGAQNALIYDSAMTETVGHFTYDDLLAQTSALAAAMLDRGVGKGDRVVIYMPMIPQSVIAMLACARIGAIHSVVFGGFAAAELATRIDDAKPKMILTASCGLEPGRVIAYKPLLDEAISLATHKPEATILYQRPQERAAMSEIDHDWEGAVAQTMGREVPCVPVKATDPLYILYTSGTTGQPKGVIRDNGGHMVALKWSMRAMYNIEPGEVFWAASDVGWVVGHSYICYAPLLHGATSVVFEGKPVGTPDAGTFWRVIRDHNVVSLFTAPTAFRAIRGADPEARELKKYDIPNFRALFLAGERADPDTIKWAQDVLGAPVIDHWWQTETGWTIAGNPVGLGALEVKLGSPAVPMPGYDIRILTDEGDEVSAGEMGNVCVKLPLPPSCFPTLWNADARFKSAYLENFPGYYETGDAGYVDGDGYLYIMSRTDDIINVAGHRLSTGQMEEIVAEHKDIAECAVLGIADEMKGQIPAGFIVLSHGTNRDIDEIQGELVKMVRERIGPVAAFKTVVQVKRLPKTRSGKILRATVQKLADGQEFKVPATIDDPAILDELREALEARGIL
jgi:propionyl-CoA synthetase